MSSDQAVSAAAFAEAGPGDRVDGLPARFAVRPTDTVGVAEALRLAEQDELCVVTRGAGTKLDWGLPPAAVDLLVDLSGMGGVLEHVAGDLVVRVLAGTRLADLAAVLAPAGQRLAVDEVVPGSTVGGVVATGLSGPGRLLYGSVRDLLIGVTVVRADGVTAHSGGKVVKNVAGYDLGKLYTGSFGTLGVVTEAIFRLHPLPERAAWVSADLADASGVAQAVAGVLHSQVVASAVEVCRPAPGAAVTVSVLLEGVAPGVAARTSTVAALLGPAAEVRDEPPAWWGSLPGPVMIKLTVQTAAVPGLLTALESAARSTGLAPEVRGSAGAGVIYAGLAGEADPPAVGRLVEALRTACAAGGGAAVLLRAPAAVRATVDPWGPVPGLSLMRRVKAEFDPGHRLSPGRFVGGI